MAFKGVQQQWFGQPRSQKILAAADSRRNQSKAEIRDESDPHDFASARAKTFGVRNYATNLYPTPRTVTRWRGLAGSFST